MAAFLSRLHHISLHVSNVKKLAYDLVSKFKFSPFAVRITDKARQFAFRKGSAIFIVNERSNEPKETLNGQFCPSNVSPSNLEVTRNHVKLGESANDLNDVNKCLYDVQAHYSVDSACNVCFEVEDVEKSFASLRDQGCDILVPPTNVQDDRGLVTYSVVKSVVGNVCHTLIDRTKYTGNFLPGFYELETETYDHIQNTKDEQCPVTHFDHITYACPRHRTAEVMRWYEKNFSFKRFFIGRNEDVEEGFVLKQNGIGLRLTAMETGIKLGFKDKNEPDCKFVIAESLPEQGRNQVETFLEQHRGPGIQHIALFTENIVATAHTMAEAGVQFFSPPPAYYTEVGKQQEIEEAGYDPKKLKQHGILLDTDMHTQDKYRNMSNERVPNRYLLQLFTKPIFSEDTFFLELIERRGASGFGEGNISALWRSVQLYMDQEEHEQHRVDS